ncbi:hypothetical protein [Zooshikella ganghwensis]|uniref:Uncharacterized protein n=1 Tax=Zooshikella ganghwensis TaxID=202772 RepID=A0A4P9VP15_9GAMM|nr:hypothetical protein [Zooshikella ganghwensis]RDH45173.1 hypothetical protein B9G39_17960 [Zooshikella ganghwensis]
MKCKNLLVLSLLISFNVAALEKPAEIKIDNIFMSSLNTATFRVVSQSANWHCDGGPRNPAWSYIHEDDPGAKTMMSGLLTAFAAGHTVQLYTIGVNSPEGKICKIVEFRIDK